MDAKIELGFIKSSLKQSSRTKEQETEALKRESDVTEHKLTVEEVCKRFRTDPIRGLSMARANEILCRDGSNALTIPRKTPEWIKLLGHLFYGFAILLWVGAILCIVAYVIQSTAAEDASKDNVSGEIISSPLINKLISCILELLYLWLSSLLAAFLTIKKQKVLKLWSLSRIMSLR